MQIPPKPGSGLAGFLHDPLDWAFGGGGQDAHLIDYNNVFYAGFVGEGIRSTLGDDYLAHAGGWQLFGVTALTATVTVLGSWFAVPAATALGAGTYTTAAISGGVGGALDYLGWHIFASLDSSMNNGGQVNPMTLGGLAANTAGGAIGGVILQKVFSVASPGAKTLFGKVKGWFAQPKVVPTTEQILIGAEARQIVSQFDTGLPFADVKLPGAAPPPRLPRPGSISGNAGNRLLETGTPLKNGSGWVKRWYRITPEDANAYQRGVYEYYAYIADLADRMRVSPDIAGEFRFNQMRQFRTNWLQEFLQNRSY